MAEPLCKPPPCKQHPPPHLLPPIIPPQVFDEEDILNELPSCIRRDIHMWMHRDLIESIPFLRNSSSDCVSEVVSRLRPLRLGHGVFLCRKGDIGTEM